MTQSIRLKVAQTNRLKLRVGQGLAGPQGEPGPLPNFATEAQAIAGADDDEVMSALRTKQAIQGGEFYNQGGTGAVDRTIPDRLRDNVSVKDFGAVGTADDTAVINAAIAATATAGQVLQFPPGTYIVDGLVGQSGTRLQGLGAAILKRKANAVGNNSILGFSSKSDIEIRGIAFDGNKANQTNASNSLTFFGCAGVTVEDCEIYGAKQVASGFGSGIAVVDGAGDTTEKKTRIANNRLHDNDGTDIFVSKEWFYEIENNFCKDSGGGINVLTFQAPPVADIQNFGSVCRNQIHNQAGSGISFGGFTEGGTLSEPLYGPTVPPQRHVVVEGNIVSQCVGYGIAWQGGNGCINGNTVYLCGSVSGGGGILFNCWSSTLVGNTVRDCHVYGIDAGGSSDSVISSNQFQWNGATANAGTIDLNLGACRGVIVQGNSFIKAGSHDQTCINIQGLDGDGTRPFPWRGKQVSILDNSIDLGGAASALGIWASRQFDQLVVRNNYVIAPGIASNAYVLGVSGCTQTGNMSSKNFDNGSPHFPAVSATTMVIPDVGEQIVVTGTTNIASILTASDNTFAGKVREVYMSAFGSGYDPLSPPTIGFSGGGGSGAAATAEVSHDGQLVGWSITNTGSGYTSAPSTIITHNGGSGAIVGSVMIGCDNFEGREITLIFTGVLTLSDGAGNLFLRGDFTTASHGTLRLVGVAGVWVELSRDTIVIENVDGLAAGVATFLATPSSANLAAALTDETGTGAAVFAGSPAFTGVPTAPQIVVGGGSNPGGFAAQVSSGSTNVLQLVNAGAPGGSSGAGAQFHAGTSAPSSGDRLGFVALGYADGATSRNGAAFAAFAAENWTGGSAHGSHWRFEATQNGTASRTEVMRLDKPTTAAQTGLMLWDVDTGQLQRVLVGAAGTGPNGTTDRALYLA